MSTPMRMLFLFRNSVLRVKGSFRLPSACYYCVNTAAPLNSSDKLKVDKKRWHLVGALCLERPPVVVPELTDEEKEIQQWLDQEEMEKSRVSDFELQVISDSKMLEERKRKIEAGEELSTKFKAMGSSETADEMEKADLEESQTFHTASKITEADKCNDFQSIERKLSENLILLIKDNPRGCKEWTFPQTIREEGETMRQAAERAIKKYLGESTRIRIYGNAPVGYFMKIYEEFEKKQVEETSSNDMSGEKIFYFRGQLLGKPEYIEPNKEHIWVSSQELCQFVNESQAAAIKKFLIY